MTPEQQPGDLSIPDPNGDPVIIQRLNPDEAIKVVGVMQALDGNMRAQVDVLRRKAETWGLQIQRGWVPWNLAWKVVCTMIRPSLRYPLLACNLTEVEGEQIVKLLYRQILPTLGACRNFPMVFWYAPAALNGLALPHPYFEQAIAHISLILTHGAIDSPTGSLL